MLLLLLSMLSIAQEDTLWSIFGGSTKTEEQEEAPPTTAELLSLFDTKSLSIPLSYEPLVIEWIDKFKGSKSRGFRSWVKRSGRFETEIRAMLKKNNLPTDLFYLAMIESGFDPIAESSAKAAGIWQFIPETGKAYGLRIDGVIDERKDPVRATQAAIEHLKDLKLELGYWHIAMAAYNAGTGLVQDAIIRHNTANYWYLCNQNALPNETKNYVPKIIAAAVLSKAPDLFGIKLPKKEKPESRTMVPFTPRKSTSIATLSEYAQISVEEFKEWNPHIIGIFLPRSQKSVRIYLPPSARTSFVQKTKANEPEQIGYNARKPSQNKDTDQQNILIHTQKYQVQQGETLKEISERYKISVRDLIRWNNLDNLDVQAGTTLSLIAPTQKKWIQHTVKKKETLKSIAKDYKCSIEELKKWNALEIDRIPTGTVLYIKSAMDEQ